MGLRNYIQTLRARQWPRESEQTRAVVEGLEIEQRELAETYERLFQAFDERLTLLAIRLRALSTTRKDRGEDIASLRDAQETLRYLLRRMEAAPRHSRELQRELEEWSARAGEEECVGDDSAIRAEILRSELALRELTTQLADQETKHPPETANDAPWIVVTQDQDARASELISPPDPQEEFQMTTPENLLVAIRDSRREVHRWHAVPPQSLKEDALLQVKHLRDLHTELKRLDRQRGITRDRLPFAPSMQSVKEESR